jgi:hypothetical protein
LPATFSAQYGASELAPHPHRYTLRGEPGGAIYPSLCPNCGKSASARIECAKVFRRASDGESPNEFVVTSADVPFCDACIAIHRAQEQKRSAVDDLIILFRTGEIFGAIFPGLGAAFLAWIGLKDLFHGQWTRFAIEIGLAAFFGFIAKVQAQSVWQGTAHLRVAPQTTVSIAFDFSDDMAEPFEPPRFICTVRDDAFASEFAALNRINAWHPDSVHALADRKRAKRTTWIVLTVLVVVAVIGWLSDHFG